jgi:intein/homing endonuclease
VSLTFSSKVAAAFFNSFGTNSTEKSLPMWILTLPKEKQVELIRGLWRGDGNLSHHAFEYTTTSPKLVEQLRMILARLGIILTVVTYTKEKLRARQRGRRIQSKHDGFKLEITGEQLRIASEILGSRHPFLNERNRAFQFGWAKDGYAYLPIKMIGVEKYAGPVYNLEVAEDDTYVIGGIAVHNCTPHVGAQTKEAQDLASVMIAEKVINSLKRQQ